MLLCQSARNVTVMRAMPVADWVRVQQATTGDTDAELRRAVRVENRVARRSVLSPSPPSGRLTGNAGAMAAWAAQLAVEWADSGYLFKPVEEGGLGVTQGRFRMSVYLTDSGGICQRPSTSGSWRPRRTTPSTKGRGQGWPRS